MSEKLTLDQKYWEKRYHEDDIPWDTGGITKPFVDYFEQQSNKQLQILIPGAGSAHEAEYLFQQGYEQVYVLDITDAALSRFHERYPDFPEEQLIHADFFAWEAQYDIILEQTFFCALSPEKREAYFNKMWDLLKPGGKLLGLLFCNALLGRSEPPFGAKEEEYKAFFARQNFVVRTFAPCYNSIQPRQGSEYFFILEKPQSS